MPAQPLDYSAGSAGVLPDGRPALEATYSIREIFTMTRIPLRTLYRLVEDGRLHTICRNGQKRGWRVTASEWDRFMREEAL